MGKYCAANGCSNIHKDKGISLHMFPKDPTLKEKWLFAMNRKGFQPTKSSSVCSVHFKPEDFEVGEKSLKDRKRVHLKKQSTGFKVCVQISLHYIATINSIRRAGNARARRIKILNLEVPKY